MENDAGLVVVRAGAPNMLRLIESAVQVGQPVLLEGVGEALDPLLEPLLLRQVTRATPGGPGVIRLGDATVSYDDRFRLYLTTALPNPHYPPEACAAVQLLDFSATYDGLQDLMLGLVVRAERPELEEARAKLVAEDAANKASLKGIEDRILALVSGGATGWWWALGWRHDRVRGTARSSIGPLSSCFGSECPQLASSSGNILDDEALITALGESKTASDQVRARRNGVDAGRADAFANIPTNGLKHFRHRCDSSSLLSEFAPSLRRCATAATAADHAPGGGRGTNVREDRRRAGGLHARRPPRRDALLCRLGPGGRGPHVPGATETTSRRLRLPA
jgi:hypothetical protein